MLHGWPRIVDPNTPQESIYVTVVPVVPGR